MFVPFLNHIILQCEFQSCFRTSMKNYFSEHNLNWYSWFVTATCFHPQIKPYSCLYINIFTASIMLLCIFPYVCLIMVKVVLAQTIQGRTWRRCPGVLHWDACLPEGTLQRHVPCRRVLPVQDDGRGAHLHRHSPHLHLHHLLPGGPQPQYLAVPRRQHYRCTGGKYCCFLR